MDDHSFYSCRCILYYSVELELTKGRVEENEGQSVVTGGVMEPRTGLSSHYCADNARREEGLETWQNNMARVFIFYVRL